MNNPKGNVPQLFEYTACPFCWKVKAMLDYKQIPHERIEVNPINKKEIAFSSYKKVPILMTAEGKQINGSTEIMHYLNETFPGRDIEETAEQQDKWMDWADERLVRALPPLIYDGWKNSLKSFDYITEVTKFSAIQKIWIKYFGAFVMFMVSKKSAKSQKITDPVQHFKNCLQEWEKVLLEKEEVKSPSEAELAIYGILRSIQSLPAFALVKERKPVIEWYQQMQTSYALT